VSRNEIGAPEDWIVRPDGSCPGVRVERSHSGERSYPVIQYDCGRNESQPGDHCFLMLTFDRVLCAVAPINPEALTDASKASNSESHTPISLCEDPPSLKLDFPPTIAAHNGDMKSRTAGCSVPEYDEKIGTRQLQFIGCMFHH
jgi:hypothetical protein